MRKIFTLLFLTLTGLTYAQQGLNPGAIFELADLNKKAEVADWLCKYDIVAWITSDSAMAQDKKEIARLGKEWFCFQDKSGTWHAVYGKYDKGVFDQVFHYTIDKTAKTKRTFEKVDTALVNSYSRALNTADKKTTAIKDSVRISFNQFIKQNEDKTFTVLIFPAFQPNGVAIYGGEFIYTIDQSGNKILKDDSYYKGNFRGFKTDKPRPITLNYSDQQTPTLGSIFFLWYYKKYFTTITIECAKSRHSVVYDENKNYSWVRAEK